MNSNAITSATPDKKEHRLTFTYDRSAWASMFKNRQTVRRMTGKKVNAKIINIKK